MQNRLQVCQPSFNKTECSCRDHCHLVIILILQLLRYVVGDMAIDLTPKFHFELRIMNCSALIICQNLFLQISAKEVEHKHHFYPATLSRMTCVWYQVIEFAVSIELRRQFR